MTAVIARLASASVSAGPRSASAMAAIRVPPHVVRSVWNDSDEDAVVIIVSNRVSDPRNDAETVPDFHATGWAVLVAPLGTPETIIGTVSDDLRKVAEESDLQKRLATLGSYTIPMSPAEATAFVHKQQQTWQPVLDEIEKTQR